MSSNATLFLGAFNEVEAHLREQLKARNSDGFSWMVRLAAKKRMITERQSQNLQEFAELRNAIVHGNFDGQRPIAEPREDVVAELEQIRDAIIRPIRALEALEPREVQLLNFESSIMEALQLIRDTDISQFPVYRGDVYIELLTTNTVARWVANDLDEDNHLDARTVGDVLEFAEHQEIVEFLPRTVTAAEAVSRMLQPGAPRCGIITEHGKKNQKPLRVISRSDVATLHNALFNPGNVRQD